MSVETFLSSFFELNKKIKSFLNYYRKHLLIFLGISLLIHLLPTILRIEYVESVKEVKRPPTTVKFIQRAPRLQKQLELKKAPKIVERTMQRMSPQRSRLATMPRTMTTSVSHGGTSLASLGRPGDYVDRTWSPQQAQLYGPNIQMEVENTRTSSRRGATGLRENLIDWMNFQDRFSGMIEQGSNKKDVSGFIEFYQLEYRGSKVEDNNQPGWNCIPQALQNLADFINNNTKIRVSLKGSIRLDSKDLINFPIIFMMGYRAEPIYTKEEAQNLGKYLREGGFLFIDDAYAYESGSFNRKVRQLIRDALGYDAVFERIPNNHPLYHAWEDFDGPPAGDDNIRPNGMSLANPNPNQRLKPIPERYKYIEGIFLNGRLAVVLSSKGYTRAWGDWLKNPSSFGGPQDNTRQLQFGLNIIVYASQQKGGIIDKNKQKVAAELSK